MTASAGTRAGRRPPPSSRIRLRLTLWHAGALAAVLLLGALSIRTLGVRALDDTFARSVQASADLVREFFRVEIAEFRTIEATVTHIAGELVFEDRAIDIHRPDGSLFTIAGHARAHRYALREPVVVDTSPLDPELAPGWTIEVHASRAEVAATQARLDRGLLLGVPIAVLLSALVGWWLAGRTLRPVGTMAAAAADLDGRGAGRLPVLDPDDEFGRLGASFNALLDRLDAAVTQQRRFLADAAHELRTPVARLRARAELGLLTLAQGGDVADARETIAALEAELRRTSRLVDDLLALARADAGGDTATPVRLDLDDLVADEIGRSLPWAATARVRVALGRLDEAPVSGDAPALSRLVAQLVDNAIRYSPADSVVTVSVVRTDAEAVLRVQDEGIGIAPADRSRVFERFHRAEAARAMRPAGSGLGLAIALDTVRAHGGTIDIGDNPDAPRGTMVEVRLPLAGDALPRPLVPEVAADARRPSRAAPTPPTDLPPPPTPAAATSAS